ncbi:hypothetical protein [Streptomyces parvulus]
MRMTESPAEREQVATSYGMPPENLVKLFADFSDPYAKFPLPADE